MYTNNINDEKDNTYELKDGRLITFSKNGLEFSVSDFLVKQQEVLDKLEKEKGEDLNSESVTTLSYPVSYTETYTASHTWYSIIGLKIFTIKAKGYFKFNSDGTITPYLEDAWYTRGTVSVWQVSNWEEGTTTHNSGLRGEFYGQGNFHYGIEYQEVGIVIQDLYCRVYGYGYGLAQYSEPIYGSDWSND